MRYVTNAYFAYVKNERIGATVAWSALLIGLIMGSSCRKDNDPPQWDVDVLAPLVRSTLTVRDIVPDSLISLDNNDAITILYSSELFAIRADTVFLIPDTGFAYSFVLPTTNPVNIPAGTLFFDQNDVTTFDLGDILLTEMRAASGEVELTVRNGIPGDVIGTVILPQGTLNGIPLSMSVPAAAGSSGLPTLATGQASLTGYRFDLRGPFFNQVNTLAINVQGRMDPAGSGALVTDQDSMFATVTYSNIVPSYARGYFGQRTIEVGPSTDDLDLFDEIVAGTFDLDAVTARVVIRNGVGVDAQLWLDQVQGENTGTGQIVDLVHPVFNAPINLNRAQDMGTYAEASSYPVTLTESNSTLAEFIEAMPDKIHYTARMDMNPLGNISNGNDFFYGGSEFRADLELEVPLRAIASGITLQNTFDVDLPGSSEAHAFQYGDLKLFALNGFPLAAEIILDIVDQNGTVLRNIPVQGTVDPGILGPDQLVQTRVNSVLTATLSSGDVDLLYQNTRVRLTVVFGTDPSGQHLTILDSYAIELQITVDGNFIVNGE